MTHSLHRRGSRKSLEADYVFQPYPAKGINDDEGYLLGGVMRILDSARSGVDDLRIGLVTER